MKLRKSAMAESLAAHLAPVLPGVTFYQGPNPQGTALPGMFVQQRYSRIQLRQAGRWLRTIGFELTYLEDRHLPELQERYEAAAEQLDLTLETFPYTDGESGTALLRTSGREWSVDAEALRYRFEVQVWTELPRTGETMKRMDYHQRVKEGVNGYGRRNLEYPE